MITTRDVIWWQQIRQMLVLLVCNHQASAVEKRHSSEAVVIKGAILLGVMYVLSVLVCWVIQLTGGLPYYNIRSTGGNSCVA